MSDVLNFDDDFMDSSWDNLFEMAEFYEEQKDLYVCEDVNFYESSVVKEVNCHTPEEALKVLFGYDSFRTGQKQIIDSIMSGRDAFAVMPTGAGKSVCYQIPAMLLPGITLVISPLISLMQDQVKALNEAGVSAAFINSALSENAFFETITKARQGLYKIIYVAPERLMTERFLELAYNIEISMVTVDEAHCISQWGQDFRPSYMKIVEFVRMLEKRPILSAFTATATEIVREDILCILGLNDPFILVTGFDRENLFFQVDKPKNKDQYVINYIKNHPDESGIIYCATRKNVDNVYERLKNNGISVARYHGGMGNDARKKMQDDFVFDYSKIVVATNAFGMGIDKSNVRFVIHYNMPQSMENYYQEAGRAGRDGLNAKCILLFSPQDIIINRFLLEHKDLSELELIDQETVKERDTKRLQTMERYCYTTECLRNCILKYFGENPGKPCEDCGNCLREFETLDLTDPAKKIINCVYEAKGRYGKSIIIDTVVGAKTARVEEVGATGYKSYGVLEKMNKNLLKRLIEQMVLEGYLLVGDYQVIKLGDISKLKNPETKILVKISDEDKITEKTSNTKKKANGKDTLTSAGYKLFDKLRGLRLEIAREENMPPYIVFNDKTLIDMASKVPVSKSEMLDVSGVGENKFARYGERFLTLIEECIGEYPELGKNKKEIRQQDESDEKIIRKKKVDLQEFFLLKEEATQFSYSDFLRVSDIRNEMNRICIGEDRKKLKVTKLTELLLAEGWIVVKETDTGTVKMPTEKGLKQGIEAMEKISEKGEAYMALMYPKTIQKMLVEYFVREEMSDEICSGLEFGMPTLIENRTLEDNISLCSDLGLSFIELNMNFPEYQIDKIENIDLFCKKADEAGIYYTIHLDENLNVADFNPLVKDAYLETVHRTIEVAKQFVPLKNKYGKKEQPFTINMHMNHGIYITLPDKKVQMYERDFDVYMEYILHFIKVCEEWIGESDIQIVIENTDGFREYEKKAIERMLESNCFALTWDIGHSKATGEKDKPFILSHKEKLNHFHVHDGSEHPPKNHLALGDGEIDLKERFKMARMCNGRCVLETKTIEALEKSVEWLNRTNN